jgi:apolipoprotein N-acyltransferase
LRVLLGPKDESAGGTSQSPGLRTGHPIKITTRESARLEPSLAVWAESFIFAGGSALLLLIANLVPHYWYFSLFALTPFLFRIIKSTPAESLRLGFLLGVSFFGAWTINTFANSPLVTLLKLLSGTALFALFGWSLGWARQRWGFNPSLIAVLWVGLEIGVVKLGFSGGVLGEAEFSHPFLGSLIGLFGFLAVSAVIVLLNALLVLAITKTLERATSREMTAAGDDGTSVFFSITRNLFCEKVYLVPEGRAPPLAIS